MAPRKRHPLAGAPDYSLLDLLEALRPQQGKGLGDLDPVRHFGVPGGIPGGGGGGGGVPNSSGAGTPAHPSLPPSPGPVRTPTVPYDPGAPPTPVQQAIRHDTPLPAGLTNPTPPLPSLTPLTPGQASPTTPQTGLTAALQQLLQLKPAALGQSALEQAQQSVPEVRHTLDTAAPITPQTDPRNQPIRIHLGQTQDGPSPSMTNTEALRTLGIGGGHDRPGSTEQQVYDALFGKGPVPPVPDLKTQLPQIPNQQTNRMTGLGTRQTLGTPSSGSVLGAVEGGTLGLTPKGGPVPGGLVTTPTTSGALGDFINARQTFNRMAQPNLAGLSPEQKAVYPYVHKAHEKYPDIPQSVLYSLIQQESNFDPSADSGVARGLTQFIDSTANEYNVDSYGTSRRAQQSQVTGAAHYLHDLGFATDPQGALSGYSGGYAASDYNNPILDRANTDYAALDKRTVVPPAVRQQYQQAKGELDRLNIEVGDAHGGQAPGVPGNKPYTFFAAKGTPVQTNRTDMGWDVEFGKAGVPILAMGDGVVTYVGDGGDYGPTFITYKLTSGPLKGHAIFLGHSQGTVQTGDVVKKGQPIAVSHGGDYGGPVGHAEIGWADPNTPGQTLSSALGTSGVKDNAGSTSGYGDPDEGTPQGRSFKHWANAIREGNPMATVAPGYGAGAGGVAPTATGGVASSLIAAGAPAGVVGAAQAQANQPPMIPLTPLAPPFAPQIAMPEGYVPTETGAPAGQDTTLLDLLQQLYTPQVSIIGQRKRR